MSGSIAYYGGIVKSGLILDLDAAKKDSYDRLGVTWRDISGNGNNGILTNGPTFDSNNNSIVFDGVDDYVNLGNPSTFQINTGTVCVWVKTTNPGFEYRSIVAKQFNYGLFFLYDTLGTYDWGNSAFRSTGIDITDGNWYYVVLTFIDNNVTSPLNNAKLYLNGIDVLTATVKFQNDFENLNIATGSSVGGQHLNGEIASLLIYNRALSSSEILQNYNALKGRFNL